MNEISPKGLHVKGKLPLGLVVLVYSTTFAANCLMLWQYWWHVAGRGSDVFYYLPEEVLGNVVMFAPYLLLLAQLLPRSVWRTLIMVAALMPWLFLIWSALDLLNRYFI